MDTKLKLESAVEQKAFVRVWRDELEEGSAHGYVLDVGPEFFLLLHVGDHVRFDGFQIMRIGDISELDSPFEHAAFAERALALREEVEPPHPRIDMTSIATILTSVGRLDALATIHRENLEPGVCHIGQVREVTEDSVQLLEITPDATWEEKSTEYAHAQITRVDIGDSYSQALKLVADEQAD